MSHRDGLTSMGQPNEIAPREAARAEKALLPQPPQVARLRIVYDRDAQESAQRMRPLPPTRPQPPTGTASQRRSMLDRNLQVKIGRMLRDVFSDVVEEPVPERFRVLLEALEAKEKNR